MREHQIAGHVRQALNRGLQDVPPAASRRLEAARHMALSRQKLSQTELQMASPGRSRSTAVGSGHPYLRNLLSALALLAGMWIAFYWHSEHYVNEVGDVDSALLSGDLPPEAFLDHDLFEWLRDSPDE